MAPEAGFLHSSYGQNLPATGRKVLLAGKKVPAVGRRSSPSGNFFPSPAGGHCRQEITSRRRQEVIVVGKSLLAVGRNQ
ncbi:MAG: hypothetical protein LBL04_07495 [Bacteroidales bacterium]|nr:hypothetical protein [Bacteroidales bacterium]